MNGKAFIAGIDNLQHKNRLLVIALIVMLIFNLMNWFSLQRARSQMQTVIVPVGGSAGMTVGNGQASAPYLRQMARLVTQMLGSYTAGTMRDQLQEVLSLFAPEVAGAAQLEFEQLAVQVERYPSISSVMRWQGEEALKFTPTMLQVQTAKDRLVNGSVSESKSVFYCIKYRIDDSRFWILSVQEREGPGIDLCFTEAPTKQKEGEGDGASKTNTARLSGAHAAH